MKTITLLMLCLMCATSSFAIETAVKIVNGGIQFPVDGSTQYKSASPPVCANGEVLTSYSGSWHCGLIRLVTNGVATCTQGGCTINACNSGYNSCDNNADNGCETILLSDVLNCGTCGNACGESGTCVNGICTYPPFLSAITSNANAVVAGDTIYLNAVLSAPAIGDTMIMLSVDNGTMGYVDPLVTVLNGQTQAQFGFTGISQGDVIISAVLNGKTITYTINVFQNPCLSTPCTSPPPNTCFGPTTLTVYSNPGTCTTQQVPPFYSCSYEAISFDCSPSACIAGACQ